MRLLIAITGASGSLYAQRLLDCLDPSRQEIHVLLRCADVMLKERRRLILVPRETPLSLIHVKNFELLLQAGATLLPANPSFYSRPTTVTQVADTVVARVLDHLGIPHTLQARWCEEPE